MIVIAEKKEKYPAPISQEFSQEGYGFFLGDIGKFLFKAIPAAIGGYLIGGPIGGVLGAATGFIGGSPGKVLKRFIYGISAGGLGTTVTGLVAPQYQHLARGTLSAKISAALSKVGVKASGVVGGTYQTGMAEKMATMYFAEAPTTMAEKMATMYFAEAPTVTTITPTIATTAGITGVLRKVGDFLTTGLETVGKIATLIQIPTIATAQMQYPNYPFETYYTDEGQPVIYEPTSDTLIVPKDVVQAAQQEIITENQAIQIAKQYAGTVGEALVKAFIEMGIPPKQALKYALNPKIQSYFRMGLTPEQALQKFLDEETRKRGLIVLGLIVGGGLLLILLTKEGK